MVLSVHSNYVVFFFHHKGVLLSHEICAFEWRCTLVYSLLSDYYNIISTWCVHYCLYKGMSRCWLMHICPVSKNAKKCRQAGLKGICTFANAFWCIGFIFSLQNFSFTLHLLLASCNSLGGLMCKWGSRICQSMCDLDDSGCHLGGPSTNNWSASLRASPFQSANVPWVYRSNYCVPTHRWEGHVIWESASLSHYYLQSSATVPEQSWTRSPFTHQSEKLYV